MEELYIQKDILPNDELIRSIIIEKYEELLQENDMLREEIQNLKYQLRTKKRAKKNAAEGSLENSENKPFQLSFDFEEENTEGAE